MARKLLSILVCGVVVVVAVAALRVSLLNDRRLDSALSELSASENDRSAANVEENNFEDLGSRVKPKPTSGARQSKTLRQRFVELATERAKRMSDEELGQAVEQITKQIADQDSAAEAELEKASEQLKSVADKFAGTPAAERANRALEAMKARQSKDALSPRNFEDSDDAFGR
jgi:hypothetical protein